MNRKHIFASVLAVLLSSLIFYYIGVSSQPVLGDRLNVEIYPETCKLYPSQTQDFIAIVHNGQPPFKYLWTVNNTVFGSENNVQNRTHSIVFGFENKCNYIVLSVIVTDSQLRIGSASVLVHDPAFTDIPKYLDATMPYSYLVETNTSHVIAYNGSTWKADYGPSTNASEIFQTLINEGINGNGNTIFVKAGDYEDIDLLMWDDSTYGDYRNSVNIIGEIRPYSRGVVFMGSGATMIRSNNTQYPSGGWGAYHKIENIRFEHMTPNADAVTLDFWYLEPELDHVSCTNTNATRQGMGIRYGSGMGVSGGNLVTCEDIAVGFYGTGMNVSADHVVFVNPSIYGCDEYGLYWKDSAWSSFVNLQIILPDGTCNQSYCIYLNHLGQGNTIFDVNIEGSATTLEKPFITYENDWKPVQIYGFYSDIVLDTGVPFWNRTSTGGGAEYVVYIEAHSGTYISDVGNYATVADNEVLSHGLLDAPWYMLLTLKDGADIAKGLIIGAEWISSTQFRVGVYYSNGTAYTTDDVDIYYYGNVNRR